MSRRQKILIGIGVLSIIGILGVIEASLTRNSGINQVSSTLQRTLNPQPNQIITKQDNFDLKDQAVVSVGPVPAKTPTTYDRGLTKAILHNGLSGSQLDLTIVNHGQMDLEITKLTLSGSNTQKITYAPMSKMVIPLGNVGSNVGSSFSVIFDFRIVPGNTYVLEISYADDHALSYNIIAQ